MRLSVGRSRCTSSQRVTSGFWLHAHGLVSNSQLNWRRQRGHRQCSLERWGRLRFWGGFSPRPRQGHSEWFAATEMLDAGYLVLVEQVRHNLVCGSIAGYASFVEGADLCVRHGLVRSALRVWLVLAVRDRGVVLLVGHDAEAFQECFLGLRLRDLQRFVADAAAKAVDNERRVELLFLVLEGVSHLQAALGDEFSAVRLEREIDRNALDRADENSLVQQLVAHDLEHIVGAGETEAAGVLALALEALDGGEGAGDLSDEGNWVFWSAHTWRSVIITCTAFGPRTARVAIRMSRRAANMWAYFWKYSGLMLAGISITCTAPVASRSASAERKLWCLAVKFIGSGLVRVHNYTCNSARSSSSARHAHRPPIFVGRVGCAAIRRGPWLGFGMPGRASGLRPGGYRNRRGLSCALPPSIPVFPLAHDLAQQARLVKLFLSGLLVFESNPFF